jgi:uncharacterized protein YciI
MIRFMKSSRPVLLFFALLVFTRLPAVAQSSESGTDSSRIYRMPSGEILKKYYFVMLTKGPHRADLKDTAAINAIQRGHLANIGRLVKVGKLVVAGPFDDDGNWRGIFIFDCNTEAEVKRLLATDPAIAAGRLAYEIHPWWTQRGTVIK